MCAAFLLVGFAAVSAFLSISHHPLHVLLPDTDCLSPQCNVEDVQPSSLTGLY